MLTGEKTENVSDVSVLDSWNDMDEYKREIETYKRKIKGYEILNSMYQKSLNQCNDQKIQIKQMQDQLEKLQLDKELEKDVKQNLQTPDLNIKNLTNFISVQPQKHHQLDIIPSSFSVNQDSSNDLSDVLTRSYPAEYREESLEFVTGSELKSIDPLVGMLNVPEKTGKQLEDNFILNKRESKSSSDGSFVRINESHIGEDGLYCNDIDDNDVLKTCEQFSDKVATTSLLMEVEEKGFSQKANLESELKFIMNKLRDASKETLESQSETFFADIAHLTKKMLQFYGRSKAIQAILEKFEKENKELKAMLSLKEGDHINEQSCSSEKADRKQEIDELNSINQALSSMISNKDHQLIQSKQHIRSLKLNMEKMRLAFNRVSTCLQENTKIWQKDYMILEEQLKISHKEKDCERQEIGKLRSEVKHLRKRLNESIQLHQLAEHDSCDVEILKQQISVYAEDFKNERRDREKAQASLETIQKKLDVLSKSFSELSHENLKLWQKYQNVVAAQSNPNTPRSYRISEPIKFPEFSGGLTFPTAPKEETFSHPSTWQCQSCTYINDGWIPYCMACDHTRYPQGYSHAN